MNETIVLGAGCFWCVEAVFQDIRGVLSVESGYSNGNFDRQPTYKEVCTGQTGFNEVLKVEFDPVVISLEKLLEVFFYTHDPTSLNRQGNDRGTQYRSGIYYNSEEQKTIALASKASIEKEQVYPDPIVTEIEVLRDYYPAEDYHQNYYKNTGDRNGYCTYVITPKVAKFRARYGELLGE